MRSSFSILLGILMITALVFTSGCKEEECDFWYEGDDCETEVRLKYYGNYAGHYNDSVFSFDFTDIITEYPNDVKRLTFNSEVAGQLYLVLTSETEFLIPFQETTTSLFGTSQWEGNGSFNGNSMSYSLSRDGSTTTTFNSSK